MAADPAALKEAIHIARAKAGIASDMQLAQKSGVHYDTIMNWYGGRTTPRPAEVQKVAQVLGVGLEDLLGPYEGRAPAPDSMQEALRRHTAAVERQNQLFEVLVYAIRDGALSVAQALPAAPLGRDVPAVDAATELALRETPPEEGGAPLADPAPGARPGRRPA